MSVTLQWQFHHLVVLLRSDRYLPRAFLRRFVFVLIISLLPSTDQFVPMDEGGLTAVLKHEWIFSISKIPNLLYVVSGHPEHEGNVIQLSSYY